MMALFFYRVTNVRNIHNGNLHWSSFIYFCDSFGAFHHLFAIDRGQMP
jgi:hypothetical protein